MVCLSPTYLNAPPTLPLHAASVPTCHVGGLREDVFLCAARSVIFLSEVVVTSRIRQRGGRQQYIDTRAEHALEVIRNEPANFLSLHKVVLVVPRGKIKGHNYSLEKDREMERITGSLHGSETGRLSLTVLAGSSSQTESSL